MIRTDGQTDSQDNGGIFFFILKIAFLLQTFIMSKQSKTETCALSLIKEQIHAVKLYILQVKFQSFQAEIRATKHFQDCKLAYHPVRGGGGLRP